MNIVRGFSRLGIGTAVLVALGGVGLTTALTIDGYSRAKAFPIARAEVDSTHAYEYVANASWWRHVL